MKKDIIINIIALFFEKLITVALIFYSEGMIARLLTPEAYGQWIYSVNFILLLSSLALVIGSEISVVALARNKSIYKEIISGTFLVRLLFSIIAMLVAILYAKFFTNDVLVKEFIYILSLYLLLAEPFGVITNYFQANVKILPVTIIRISGLFIRVLVIYIFFNYYRDVMPLLPLSRVLEIIVIVCSLQCLFFVCKSNFKFIINLHVIRILFLRGIKLWPALIFMYLFQRLDRFYIEYYFSFDVLGQYGIAVQLMEQGFLLLGIVVQSISPKLIYLKASQNEIRGNLLKLLIVIFLVSVIFLILGYVLIPYFIFVVYGDNYSLASDISKGMLFAIIFFGIDTVITQYLYREKKSLYILLKWIAMSIIMSVSYYLAYSVVRIESLSIVYIINYILMSLISVIILLKTLSIRKA
ncbi:polysaccharide biosynthesis protein [Haemophilus parainfluenzae ATCC 33392]|uniref:Oligosaccharide flippase family protein n=1 Tax=Haemophilus parainfluenzae ATCC 33392 TaxID=888828 RepID=A0ABD7ZDS8_HAEPA|nr:oligosaccharide flippase family protein [Haemophilus parainfluenzae]EGC73008.1 polysaccharide biosynthesis protein [Haemophilus parainfluenzae ATCC 33392]KFL99509.1 polysaccharide biosynthesis protein [Haemophilus parainfluenzae ATCC 33392]QQB23135.1 oligosaccharide flippase family protein [Haemophilus parainfluenzae]WMS22907.1 oligosaccharide flippase family protein [Haemophilus parainfluenzae ATCC 33392]STO94477.1 Polysaccharide biosynthesis protein [Haemophilus parainfluenzae ATCC 33392]